MDYFESDESESDVTYGQVWWPILGIWALQLTHPKCTHTAVNTNTPWTHTRSSGQPFMLRRPGSRWGFGALLKGTSVVVLKVERALYIHSPHLQFLPARDSNSQPLDYESDSLTIRPRLPHDVLNDVLTTFLDLDRIRILAVYGRVRELSECIKNILICVPKMNKGLTGLERHEGE